MKKKQEELKKVEEEMKKAADSVKIPPFETHRENLLKRMRETDEQKKGAPLD